MDPAPAPLPVSGPYAASPPEHVDLRVFEQREKGIWESSVVARNSMCPGGEKGGRGIGEILPPPGVADGDHQFRELHER